jgi:hypothetical protein
VSVFGVFRDGQMSLDAWDSMSARLSPPLGGTECEAGFGPPLSAAHAELSAAVEDYARANGPTDDLLAQIAPAARGDLVVLFTVEGKVTDPKSAERSAGASGGGGAGGGSPMVRGPAGMGGRGARRRSGPRSTPTDSNALDVTATIYSVSQRKSVAAVDMTYTGLSMDDALTKFAVELAKTLPQAECRGWDWTANVDADGIRRSMEP